ncbi:MAG: response regulator, partial [Candidatus Thermoplasmatota archaeon]|nr:response regulator [Candidatus Thermoplasmatota archaeon]
MKKIMIVDDEPDQIFTAKTALENLDEEFEVMGVGNGEQCIEMLNSGEIPDLIISETKMQGMTGRELSDKLRENPAWQDIPMMFLTVWKDKFEENPDFSGDNHIEKPFDMMDFKTRI